MGHRNVKRYLFVFTTVLLVNIPSFAQGEFSIEWVGQFPENNTKTTGGSVKWIQNFIFGERPDRLIKPISLVGFNPDSMLIADQGSGLFFKSSNKKEERVRFRGNQFESFPAIVGCCLMPDNNILFTDSYLNDVFKFNPNTRRPELFVLNDSLKPDQPTGIAYSSQQKQIWLIETGLHSIAILDINGKLIKRLGQRGNDPGQFNYPTHIWIDKQGYAYVVDAMNYRVQIFDNKGVFVSMFGEAGDASGFFSRPKGIATDSYGHIYIADALFHVVQVFDSNGQFLYDFGGKGKEKGEFMIPAGIYIDDKDYIYIADSYNSRIQVFMITRKD